VLSAARRRYHLQAHFPWRRPNRYHGDVSARHARVEAVPHVARARAEGGSRQRAPSSTTHSDEVGLGLRVTISGSSDASSRRVHLRSLDHAHAAKEQRVDEISSPAHLDAAAIEHQRRRRQQQTPKATIARSDARDVTAAEHAVGSMSQRDIDATVVGDGHPRAAVSSSQAKRGMRQQHLNITISVHGSPSAEGPAGSRRVTIGDRK